MPLVSFTRNFADNSTEAGFQFTFFCDNCEDGYKSGFIESKTYKKASFFKGIGKAVSIAADLTGVQKGYTVERGADVLSERFEGMSPEWHREHEQAFQTAQNEVMGRFHKCPGCRQWVCDTCWNDEEGLCVKEAPHVAAEVAAARAAARKKQIWEKAEGAQVFTGEVAAKQTMCPECGKPAGTGKFCQNCGASLALLKCSRCGAENPASTRFCGECGMKLS